MKSRQLSNRLLVSMVLVCCCQQIWAGLVVKGGKTKNSTITTKATSQTTKQPKVQHKAKTTTTTTPTPELETTTLPADLDLDGRSAFINNQYVENSEPIPDTSPPLYELLQQQMETVLSNTGGNIHVYANDSPQMKEALDNEATETQKPPGKPIFGYDMGQFDDYDEEETSEYEGEYIPDNCEDTQESLGDNEGDNGYAGAAQLSHSNSPVLQTNYGQTNVENSEPNIYEHSTQNKPYDSSNYAPQSSNDQGAAYGSNNQNKPNDSSNYAAQTSNNQGAGYGNNNQNKPNESNNYAAQQTNTNQGQSYGNNTPQNGYASTKPMPQHNHNNNKAGNKAATKPKPSSQHNSPSNYGQTKPNEQYQQPQQHPANHYVQSKPMEHYGHANQKPLTNQNSYGKPQQQQNQKPYYITGKPPQNLYSNQKPSGNNKASAIPLTQQTKTGYSKPNQGSNSKPSYSNNYPTTTSTSFNNNSYNNSESLSSPYGSFNPLTTSPYTHGSSSNTLNPSLAPNFSYGNTNTVTSSPFSGNNNKLPHNGQKRHLTFRTVSSSTQYVSTPLADLMFKFSIGMAKSSNSKLGNNSVNNQAQVFNVLNDIDAKTE
ncbi:GATA zinc finger domain-containing protein 14 [Calliphora vicina]|uniref:GATA zinc finger domain-containing protein 14 n=1 Tax=Calliphora vicina TaxID=7373 RepID=UPI00325A7C60